MKKFLPMLCLGALALNVSACGNKGKLKTPTQIEIDEQKKAHRLQKKQEEEAKRLQEQNAAPRE